MRFATDNGAAIVALAIFAHAWVSRLQAPPPVLSAIGWVIVVLAFIALVAVWVR